MSAACKSKAIPFPSSSSFLFFFLIFLKKLYSYSLDLYGYMTFIHWFNKGFDWDLFTLYVKLYFLLCRWNTCAWGILTDMHGFPLDFVQASLVSWSLMLRPGKLEFQLAISCSTCMTTTSLQCVINKCGHAQELDRTSFFPPCSGGL